MRPKWFNDSIPLDPMIAPLVFFLQKNGIHTTNSCEGGDRPDHLYGQPTIGFCASSLDTIDRVYALLKDHELDTSISVGLMTGFFDRRYGQVSWLWRDLFKSHVYDRAVELVPMDEVNEVAMDIIRWRNAGHPTIGTKEYIDAHLQRLCETC